MSKNGKTGVSVVLNGGEKEMNSATIPIRWFYSDEVIDKIPRYILFFEQNEREKEDFGNASAGRRYACKASDACKFIQLFSSGYHRMMIVVVAGGDEEKAIRVINDFLDVSRRGYYSLSLRWKKAEEGDLSCFSSLFVAFTVVEFEVPEELFAKKPETKLGKAIWKWVNLLFDEEPVDKCHYWKRNIIAPFIVPIWCFFKYLICGTVYSLYVLLASLITFFVGYRPRHVLKEMWGAFTFNRYNEWSVKKDFDLSPYDEHSHYRLWSVKRVNKKGEKLEELKYKYMPITPLVASLVLSVVYLVVYGIYYFISDVIRQISFNNWVIIFAIPTVSFFLHKITLYSQKNAFKREEKRRKAEILQKEKAQNRLETQKREYKKWMMKNFGLSNKPEKVDLKHIPIPQDLSERVIQKFYVGFWMLKIKVCKPFSN
jgi:hypothetical protein